MSKRIWLAATLAAVVALSAMPSSAMTIREFRKFSDKEQGHFIGAAVSMLAYAYAANGDPGKGRCIREWYYGTPGKPTPGPRAIALEIAVAEQADADKYDVEGVILGVTDQACNAQSSNGRPLQGRP